MNNIVTSESKENDCQAEHKIIALNLLSIDLPRSDEQIPYVTIIMRLES